MDSKKVVVLLAVIVIAAVAIGYAVANPGNDDDRKVAVFDLNYDGSEPIKTKASAGTYISAPDDPNRANNTFSGWFMDKDCKNAASFPYELKDDVTFYAKWVQSAAAEFFNVNFLTDTEEGKALAAQYEKTTGSQLARVNGNPISMQYVSHGLEHAVYLMGDGNYTAVDLVTFKVLFSFPSDDVLGVKSTSKDSFAQEYITVATKSGYYIYDLKGNSFGPSSAKPVEILKTTVFFNDGYYRFDSDGNLKLAFERTMDTYTPEGGSNGIYYCFDKMTYRGTTRCLSVKILDDSFRESYEIEFPKDSQFCQCVSLHNGKCAVQYAVPVEHTSKDYTFIYSGTKYDLTTLIVGTDEDDREISELENPIAYSFDSTKQTDFKWSSLAFDIKNIIALYNISSGRTVYDESLSIVSLNDDGTVYKVLDDDALIGYNLAFATCNEGLYASYHVDHSASETTIELIDGTGQSFKAVLRNVANPHSASYFVTYCAVAEERTDFIIYDTGGKAIYDYTGMEYIGHSDNLLFFTMGGEYYLFDGEMKLLNGAEDIVISDSCYGCLVDDIYTFYTENGTVISEAQDGSVRDIHNIDGTHIIELSVTSGVYRTYIMTTE